MEQKGSYNLCEIAEWGKNEMVSLPSVQRGFVWKAYQIENLWDSLLRGYPVGAFVLSPGDNGTFQVLDGQQRATAICLGFGKETFRYSQDFIKVFIDIEEPNPIDSRKFFFRVITRSHPWGYKRQENNKALTSENIRRAMEIYDSPDPLTAPLDEFFPYDAMLPIPFHFFINASLQGRNKELLYSQIFNWDNWNKVYTKFLNSFSGGAVNNNDSETLEFISAKINVIFETVCNMLDSSAGQKIPALYLNIGKMLHAENDEQDDASDEIENLFIRLNSGGTQLSGEELNYSILKAHLNPNTQLKIENATKQLFRPARFITIAYRLFQQKSKQSQQTDALTMRVKPKQFQRTVTTQVNTFESFLIEIIENKQIDGKTLIEYGQCMLAFQEKEQPYGLPFLLYSKISDIAPELMFLLLYRILIKGDRFKTTDFESEKEHRIVLGMLTLFLWFGKGENLKDHSRLLSNIWPAVSNLPKESFWSFETIERALMDGVLLNFPLFNSNSEVKGLDAILNYRISEKANLLNKFEKETGKNYRHFLQNIIYNKDIILYAQRFFIEKYFKEDQFRLEDTSVPFDWDHLFPNRLVHSKWNVPTIVREWYQTNGNFRAWPYALNRMDSDRSPGYKLKPLHRSNYPQDDILENTKKKWTAFIHNNRHIITNLSDVHNRLLIWSFCEQQWAECNYENVRADWKPIVDNIVRRNILLIKEWYEQLYIDKLKQVSNSSIEDLFDKRKWKKLVKDNVNIEGDFDIEDNVNWVTGFYPVNSSQIQFYLYYPNIELGYLQVDNINFGLYEVKGGTIISQLKEDKSYSIDNQFHTYVERSFTLTTMSKNSLMILLSEILGWLKELPIKKLDKIAICNHFQSIIPHRLK